MQEYAITAFCLMNHSILFNDGPALLRRLPLRWRPFSMLKKKERESYAHKKKQEESRCAFLRGLGRELEFIICTPERAFGFEFSV